MLPVGESVCRAGLMGVLSGLLRGLRVSGDARARIVFVLLTGADGVSGATYIFPCRSSGAELSHIVLSGS